MINKVFVFPSLIFFHNLVEKVRNFSYVIHLAFQFLPNDERTENHEHCQK